MNGFLVITENRLQAEELHGFMNTIFDAGFHTERDKYFFDGVWIWRCENGMIEGQSGHRAFPGMVSLAEGFPVFTFKYFKAHANKTTKTAKGAPQTGKGDDAGRC
jgi:hypothetical protein